MCTTGDLRAHQCILTVENVGIDLFQSISSDISVTIACRSVKTVIGDALFSHSLDDFYLI